MPPTCGQTWTSSISNCRPKMSRRSRSWRSSEQHCGAGRCKIRETIGTNSPNSGRATMVDDATFLAAILAGPDDDGPRLVYADWLEEHGDTERSEFIRVQIELAHTPVEEGRAGILRRREAELLRQHRD